MICQSVYVASRYVQFDKGSHDESLQIGMIGTKEQVEEFKKNDLHGWEIREIELGEEYPHL